MVLHLQEAYSLNQRLVITGRQFELATASRFHDVLLGFAHQPCRQCPIDVIPTGRAVHVRAYPGKAVEFVGNDPGRSIR